MLADARTRRALKTGGLAVVGILLLLGLAFFAFRNAALRRVLDRKISAYEQRHSGAVVRIGAARFSGLAGVDLEDIRVRSAAGTLEVVLGRCSVQVSFWKMLFGQLRLTRLALADLRVDVRQGTAPAPVKPAVPGKAAPPLFAQAQGQPPDFAARAAGLLDLYFNRIPDSLVIDRFTLHTTFDNVHQALYVPRLAIHGPAFETTVEVYDQGRRWACLAAGRIERGKRGLELSLRPVGVGALAVVPFADRQWGLKVGFESLAVGLHSLGRRNGVLRLEGTLAGRRLALNHPRISADDVNFENAALDFALAVGPDYVELAAPTRVIFNRLSFQPTVRFVARPTRQVVLKVPETRFAAADLFASLPEGLFTSLAGLQASGELAFHLDFAIDLARPDDVVLDVGLDKRGFRIARFGRVDFRAINGPFTYTAYEKDRALRSFTVGPENPDFLPLERISPFLKSAVMIAEDGAFFAHKGFLLEPFKKSIAVNLKAGRFVRGASTISMQLVKNLYLRRYKTIARKLEEILITWLIEENRLISKERMLEIYLNIIEWGPGVYGAQEAARYYFAKDAGDLTLGEAIFMSAVIPRPKRFMYFFDEYQRLRSWLPRYYADVSAKMLRREWITQADVDALAPEVALTGPARLLLKPIPVPDEEPPEFDLFDL
jgi:hypothetical protein